MGECVFCRITAGEASAHVVYDDPEVVAILDVRPLFPGHTLVLPRGHVKTLADLAPEHLPHYFSVVQRLSRAVPAATASAGSFVAMNNVVSQSVPHLHCHVVPRNPKDGLRGFFWPRSKYRDEGEMSTVAAAIRSAYEQATT